MFKEFTSADEFPISLNVRRILAFYPSGDNEDCTIVQMNDNSEFEIAMPYEKFKTELL